MLKNIFLEILHKHSPASSRGSTASFQNLRVFTVLVPVSSQQGDVKIFSHYFGQLLEKMCLLLNGNLKNKREQIQIIRQIMIHNYVAAFCKIIVAYM